MKQRILIAGGFFTVTAVIAVFLAIFALGAPLRFSDPGVIVVTPTESSLSVASLFDATMVATPTALATEVASAITPSVPTLTPTPLPLFPPSTPSRTGCQSYTINSGDTLIYIAAVWDITLDDLMQANGLSADDATRLQIGQVLVIPLSGCTVSRPIATSVPKPTGGASTPAATRIPRTKVPATSNASGAPGNITNLDLSKFRVVIPSLKLNLAVVTASFIGRTWDFAPISYSAGWLDGLALPGASGNVVIGAHSELAARKPGPFYRLNRIQIGDIIIVTYNGAAYRYAVQRMWVVVPTDISPIDQNVGDVLTLLTCDGFNPATGGYDTRLIVRAVRVG